MVSPGWLGREQSTDLRISTDRLKQILSDHVIRILYIQLGINNNTLQALTYKTINIAACLDTEATHFLMVVVSDKLLTLEVRSFVTVRLRRS